VPPNRGTWSLSGAAPHQSSAPHRRPETQSHWSQSVKNAGFPLLVLTMCLMCIGTGHHRHGHRTCAAVCGQPPCSAAQPCDATALALFKGATVRGAMGKRRGNEHTAQRRMERKKQKEKKREQAEQNPHPGRKLVKIVTEHFESEAPACMCACKAKKTQPEAMRLPYLSRHQSSSSSSSSERSPSRSRRGPTRKRSRRSPAKGQSLGRCSPARVQSSSRRSPTRARSLGRHSQAARQSPRRCEAPRPSSAPELAVGVKDHLICNR
jgi:hypothetical protein